MDGAGGERAAGGRGGVLLDAAALACLVLGLLLPWNLSQLAGARVEVDLAAACSAASLAVGRARAGGGPVRALRWSSARWRAVGAAPLVLLVVVSAVVDAARGLVDDRGRAGLGGAVAVLLAGALLAARPRAGEDAGAWRVVLAVVAGWGAVGALVAGAVAVHALAPLGPSAQVRPALAALVPLVLLAPLVAGLREGPARTAAVVVGAASALSCVVAELASLAPLGLLQSSRTAGYGLVALAPGAAAALAVRAGAPGARPQDDPPGSGRGERGTGAAGPDDWPLAAADAARLDPAPDDGERWLAAARWTAGTTAALGVPLALMLLDSLLTGVPDAVSAAELACVAVGAGLALAARTALARAEPGAAARAARAAGAAALVGAAGLVVAGGAGSLVVVQAQLLLAVLLPVAAVALLSVPVGVRRRLRERPRPTGLTPPPRPTRAPAPDRGTTPGTSGARFLPGRGEPGAFTAHQAADPSTPPALLAAIVELAPELRPAVAANPAASRELLDRLRAAGDPRVDAVLRARGQD